MRGLFFDIADLLVGAKHDRGWAKRHAGAGKGKRLSYSSGGVNVSWAWWALLERRGGERWGEGEGERERGR